MQKIYSNSNPSILMHIIHRVGDIDWRRNDVVASDEFLQLATMKLPKGKTFKPHRHILKTAKEATVLAQESWVCIKGSVKCILYDFDDQIIATPVLYPGDCSVTLYGGHNYEILEDDTLVYEFKTGPYEGQEKDKVFI